MNSYIFFIIFIFILTGCARLPSSSNQGINPTPINTTSPDSSVIKILSTGEEVDFYTQGLHDRIQSCIEFRDIYDFTVGGELIDYKLGVQKIRECIDNVHELQIPEECESCGELVQLVEAFSNQTLESMNMIEDGHELQKEVYISEGLVTFWDADLLWEVIKLTIGRIRAEYNLPEIN